MSNPEKLRPTSHEPSIAPAASPAESIAPSSVESAPPPSALHRTVQILLKAVPLVQRLLPLLDGNIATTVANVLAPQSFRPAPSVNLAPVEDSVTKLRVQNIELHDQLAEQSQALKRLETRLEAVREAAERTNLRQQELLGSMRKAAKRVWIFAFTAFALLILSLLLDLALYIQMERALR
jgi:hypothetical protein